MDLDREASSTEEYFMMAVQIFDYCGADSGGTLRVDALMEKFAPFVKTNKDEYSYLKSLLDPEQSNPKINATKLGRALNQYSDTLKTKVDLDESFNLKTGSMPQDSDSGISTDGFQLLEDLQCELREKSHLAAQLRSQLDYTDHQHEEALAALSAERDSLKDHLNMLRDENMALTDVRRDYEEMCDRLSGNEKALAEARHELDTFKKQRKVLMEQVSTLENEKLTLLEQLTKSKDECHRINEMYSSRQSALREENETLKTEHADLSARLQDQEEFMQQIIKEKVLLEMELKDMLNKSNQTQLRLDGSIDVSYTEDQMLTALDTINADSRFTPENHLLDEESFASALKEDQGRATNLSLFDEIRLSFSNMSRQSMFDNEDAHCDQFADNLDNSLVTIGTQTDDSSTNTDLESETKSISELPTSIGVQTDELPIQSNLTLVNTEIQTENFQLNDNNNCGDCIKCHECVKLQQYTTKLESDLNHYKQNIKEMRVELDKYEDNLVILQKFLDEGTGRNNLLQTVVIGLQSKINILEAVCADQKSRIDVFTCESCCAECQTDSDQSTVATQVDVPCVDCEKRRAVVPQRSLRKYLWEPLKCLFQVFAVVSFVCAVSVLYGVTRRWNARCVRDTSPVPWRWLDAQEFMDLLLRIDYVDGVPM